jgi:hypothetical protein
VVIQLPLNSVPDEQPTITLEARRERVNNAAKLRIHLQVVAREIVAFGTAVQPERDHSDDGGHCKKSDLPGIRHGAVLRVGGLAKRFDAKASCPKTATARVLRITADSEGGAPEAVISPASTAAFSV